MNGMNKTNDRRVTLFHSPQSRSGGALVLLEELGADYELQVLDLRAGEQREPAYRAINPLGKVPAIRHQGAIVTEQVAIYIYLADLYRKEGQLVRAKKLLQRLLDDKAFGNVPGILAGKALLEKM